MIRNVKRYEVFETPALIYFDLFKKASICFNSYLGMMFDLYKISRNFSF